MDIFSNLKEYQLLELREDLKTIFMILIFINTIWEIIRGTLRRRRSGGEQRRAW
jgi:hypothetical protein